MAILNNSNAISSGGYDINNSLRFRSSASAYLNRTPASAGNRKIWTWSAWVKRGSLGTSVMFSGGATSSDTGVNYIGFLSDQLIFAGISTYFRITSQVLRDPSAWYHIVVAFDSTQATANNRCLMYINGNVVTAFTTNNTLTLNTDYGINQAAAHRVASESLSGGFGNFDGYMTDINFIDGQALTPSSFGETDTTTGSWKPKAYTGTYGTNGFYLKFSDIATTSGSNAGLGKDFSGNANYWTTNNISVTAGTTYDAMIDSPTLTSATVANYAVMNPLVRLYGTATLSDANLKINDTSTGGGAGYATIAVTSGKFYYEFTPSAVGKTSGMGVTFASTYSFGYDGCYVNNGSVSNTTGGSAATYASYTTNDVIGVAFDADAGKVWFYKNGTIQAGDPVAGTGSAFTWAANSLVTATYAMDNSAGTVGINANFGQRPFAYTPPTGFVRLNTYNLPDSTIKKGNTVMDATLYTGTGSTQTITNAAGFKPDFVWVKTRSSGSYGHALFDSVRGTPRRLASNLTEAENTTGSFGQVSAFNSNGFTVATGSSDFGETGANTLTYVGWQWQAGQGSTSSNTSGSITSTVSVNTTAGFSIVTYTGNGSSATVGHGLGVAPKMIIVKNRSGAENWMVYRSDFSAPASDYMQLNTTGAKSTFSNIWGGTATSSLFYLGGSYATLNSSGNNYVAYCWAAIPGFSAFGSYTGNGNADGPMIFTGFRPKFIMTKRTDTINDWAIIDTSRSSYNVSSAVLFPDLSDAEQASGNLTIDVLSNGFKLRATSTNTAGGNYIYACFASNPFKNSNAV
jgi:hypothetical protein